MRTGFALLAAVLVLLILLSAFALVRGPAAPGVTNASSTQTPARGYLKGLSFTPESYDQRGMSSYFADAKQAGSVVTWAGDWNELSDPRSAPFVLVAQAKLDNLTVLPELQLLNSSSGQLLRPLNSSNEEHYQTLAVSFAQTYKPQYMALGVEVNLLHESSPTDFQTFVSFFNTTRAAIKTVSPETSVFTIFQLEKMKGSDGGLFGGVNDTANAEWGLLADFPSSDLFGFTTYPGLLYHSPSSVPGSYYAEIAEHTQKQVAFTEVGWQSGTLPGWDNNETTQAGFVKTFFDLTSGLPKAVVVWAFAYDQNTAAPFSTMGLLKVDGTPKQAWDAWLRDR